MLRHLRIGNVRDNKLHRRGGTNLEVCQVQILGINQDNNPMHGVFNNNQLGGMHKILLNNNRPQGGAHNLPLLNNKLLAGDKILLNNNPPRGTYRTPLNNNRPQGGARKTQLRNNLLRGVLQVQEV
jgi:hypothetical protein